MAIAYVRREIQTQLVNFHDDTTNQTGIPNITNAVKFTDAELAEVVALVARFSQYGEQSDMQMLGPPTMPSAEVQAMIENRASTLLPPIVPCPWWAKLMAASRDEYFGCAVAAVCDEDDTRIPDVIYALSLAVQSPHSATFVRATRVVFHNPWAPVYVALYAGTAMPLNATMPLYRHTWNCVNDVDVPFHEDSLLVVLPNVIWSDEGIRTPHAPVPFEQFVASCARRPRPPAVPKARTRHTKDLDDLVKNKLLDEYPWMKGKDIEKAMHVEEKVAKEPAEDVEVDGDDHELCEEEVLQKVEDAFAHVAAEVADLRDRYEVDPAEDTEFYVKFLSGKWTLDNIGVAADRSGSFARTHVFNWCEKFHWPKMKTFSFNLYGRDNAVQLSKGWARRSSFLCHLWIEAGTPQEFEYTLDSMRGFHEPLEWLDWSLELDVMSDAFGRVKDLQDAVPRM